MLGALVGLLGGMLDQPVCSGIRRQNAQKDKGVVSITRVFRVVSNCVYLDVEDKSTLRLVASKSLSGNCTIVAGLQATARALKAEREFGVGRLRAVC